MSILVIAEHDNTHLASATAHTVTAAAKLGSDIQVLVAGNNAQAAAAEAAKLAGVSKVLLADAPYLASPTAENVGATVLSILPGSFTHVVLAATGFGNSGTTYGFRKPAASTANRSLSVDNSYVSAPMFRKKPWKLAPPLFSVMPCKAAKY